ncbi:hypothetical protein HBZC1_13430 [Helicobacter bizzozeronii CIII-1]|uniref:Uncharacterized protein n=2 Tax=Helicobacter bizzozeronii TaxID=56877 RepID=F8KTZ4_HELBC|nr:hypothetical protein HBZC1_13430 [Helicobacter bizzozeronii CIII-1]
MKVCYNTNQKESNMACKFCPKIKPTDLLFVLVAGVAFYGVYTYQMKQAHQEQEQRAKAFEKLQRDCILGHDKSACQQVFKD